MQIQLQQIIPIPLADQFKNRQSDIWNKDVNCAAGEWIKIKAPSGTGKTTLLHTIYKIRHDYRGKILWNGKDIHAIKNDELAGIRQQKMSVIFQDLRLFAHLTARENIELNRVMQKPFYEAKKMNDMAAALGIGHIMEQKAGICSYGEQQRIAIIRALMQPFEWLIMDEPFSHLDNANTEKAAKLIAAECQARRAGFILTDLDEDDNFAYTKFYNL